MSHHREQGRPPDRSSTEGGRPEQRVRRRLFSGPLTVEAYLRASNPPRYMQRLREMEAEYGLQRRRLEVAYRSALEDCGDDPVLFERRWRAEAERWPFSALNELIREHNAWYPAESDLPMDPRTGDYVLIRGASYRRIELGPWWVLEHLPPSPSREGVPRLPRRAPREPR